MHPPVLVAGLAALVALQTGDLCMAAPDQPYLRQDNGSARRDNDVHCVSPARLASVYLRSLSASVSMAIAGLKCPFFKVVIADKHLHCKLTAHGLQPGSKALPFALQVMD